MYFISLTVNTLFSSALALKQWPHRLRWRVKLPSHLDAGHCLLASTVVDETFVVSLICHSFVIIWFILVALAIFFLFFSVLQQFPYDLLVFILLALKVAPYQRSSCFFIKSEKFVAMLSSNIVSFSSPFMLSSWMLDSQFFFYGSFLSLTVLMFYTHVMHRSPVFQFIPLSMTRFTAICDFKNPMTVFFTSKIFNWGLKNDLLLICIWFVAFCCFCLLLLSLPLWGPERCSSHWCVYVCVLSCVGLFVTPRTAACQAPLSTGFSLLTFSWSLPLISGEYLKLTT